MFLHRLELQGFKSFVDKTELQFGDGITGVIGPNGCGKTNVSDAIRWVMGEQSAKQLRGDSMEDVIFNGCPTRKPLGMAEVHLTFKNDRGILPTEFSEVTVSRRVFRSGMSEYFLNKTPCRLRDIRDLFFDTGMGSHAYSVIERSMVDHILSDNTGHRRFLFEEASGITKYKSRKKEALSKLDATESDLTRLNDIVFEIERELRSLARQVGKARRHQRLRDEIRDLDLMLTADSLSSLRAKEKEAREQWQEEAVRREGVTTGLDALEAKLNDQKLALLELERELATAQSGLRDREDARTRAEHQVVLLRERADGLTRRAGEAADETSRLGERLAETLDREREAETKRNALGADRENAQVASEQAETALQAVEAELRERRSIAVHQKQMSLDLFSVEAEKRGACERARERQSSLNERREGGERRRAELEARLAELSRAIEDLRTRRAGLELELDESERGLGGADQRLAELAARERAGLEMRTGLQQERAAVESRLHTLLELKREFEGVSEGVKALFGEKQRSEGLLGVVADVLEVPARYLDALEASLGEAAAFVLCEDRAAVDSALQRLRALPAGRATLVDLSAISASHAAAAPEGEGVLGRASDLVRCTPKFRALVERLLGSVIVVQDRAVAMELALRSESGLRFVSLDGEVWERGRVRAGAKAEGGLLHREQQIRELSGQMAEIGLALEAATREEAALEGERRERLADRAMAESERDARRSGLERLSRDAEAAERERRWAETERDERDREIATFLAELETLARTLDAAERDLAEYQQQMDRARSQLSDLDGTVRQLEARRDEAGENAAGHRETLLRLAREEGEWQATWARSEQTRRELEAAIESRRTEERSARQTVAEIEAEVTGLQSGLTGLLESEGGQRERVVGLQKRFHALKEEAGAIEEQARQRRFEQTELSELLHQIELSRLQAHSELDLTFERLRTEYQLNPADWQPPAKPEGWSPEESAKRLEESRERFRTLGVVNLLAVEEYSRKKERYTFLTKQREDLTSARAQLLEAIEKINVTASELFRETFGKVQDHFREIFTTLFEGGDAELRMSGEDPLECEIEIAAKPRGKHLQSISLMSGGERALTAIALLFAIYLVKPSPFCLLDEVDAPLDDANVDRFLRMLERFSNRTQFVVITHNKKTMEAGRCLYGVTMQELGVSKLVSVRFDGQDASLRREVEEAEPAAV
jgi:chromosome segregation protein